MTDEAAAAVANSFRFEAKKDKLGQLQSGQWVLTFKVKPDEVPYGLLTAAMGTRFMVAAVELSDDETATEQPAEALETPEDTLTEEEAQIIDYALEHQVLDMSETTEAAPGKASAKTGGFRLGTAKAEECGRFCNDPGFQDFVSQEHDVMWRAHPENLSIERITADCVRMICRIDSRRELDKDDGAWQRWCGLMSDYACWANARLRLQEAGEE